MIVPTTRKSEVSILNIVQMTGKRVVLYLLFQRQQKRGFFTSYCSNDREKHGFLYLLLSKWQESVVFYTYFCSNDSKKRTFPYILSLQWCTHTLRVGRLGQNRQGGSGRQQGSTEGQQWIRSRPAQCLLFTSKIFFLHLFNLFDKSLHHNLQILLNITNIIYDYEHSTRKKKKNKLQYCACGENYKNAKIQILLRNKKARDICQIGTFWWTPLITEQEFITIHLC